MDDAFIQNAVAYATRHQLQLAERLGFGIHIISRPAEMESRTRIAPAFAALQAAA